MNITHSVEVKFRHHGPLRCFLLHSQNLLPTGDHRRSLPEVHANWHSVSVSFSHYPLGRTFLEGLWAAFPSHHLPHLKPAFRFLHACHSFGTRCGANLWKKERRRCGYYSLEKYVKDFPPYMNPDIRGWRIFCTAFHVTKNWFLF